MPDQRKSSVHRQKSKRNPRRLLLAGVLSVTAVPTPPALLAVAESGSAQVLPAVAAGLDTADVIDGFGGAVGSVPAGWRISGGTATVQDVPDTIDRGLRLTDTSADQSLVADRPLGTTAAPVVAGVRLRAGQTTAVISVHLDSTAGHAATVGLGPGNRLYTYDGTAQVWGAWRESCSPR